MAHHAVPHLALAGLQREKAHLVLGRHVVGHHEGQGRLAVGGIPADHDHVARLSKRALVHLAHAECDVLRRRCGRVLGGKEIVQHLPHGPGVCPAAVGQQLPQVSAQRAAIVQRDSQLQLSRQLLDPIQRRLLVHDNGILPPVGAGDRVRHEIHHVAVVIRTDPVPDSHRVHGAAGLEQRPGCLKDQPVGRIEEVLDVHSGQHIPDDIRVNEHGPNDGPLCVQLVIQLVLAAHSHP